MKKTTIHTEFKNATRQWVIVDAAEKPLGKVAVLATDHLRGKNRPDYTPHIDCGDYVIITNVEKIAVSGSKESDKKYFRYSGYKGNVRTQNLSSMREKNPQKILKRAIYGMLQKNRLRPQQMKRLTLVVGDKNPHEAQKPTPISLSF